MTQWNSWNDYEFAQLTAPSFKPVA